MQAYRVEYVQLKGWDADIAGLWLAENEDWLLLSYIPCDYQIDGYVLLAKQHIATRLPGKGREQTEQILKLKGVRAEKPAGFKFRDAVGLLHWTEQQYGLLHFMEDEIGVFIGWINEVDPVHLWIDTLDPDATVAAREPDELPFAFGEIRVIIFNDDYSQSLKLLWQHRQQQSLLKPSAN